MNGRHNNAEQPGTLAMPDKPDESLSADAVLVVGYAEDDVTRWVADGVSRWVAERKEPVTADFATPDQSVRWLAETDSNCPLVVLVQDRPRQFPRALPERLVGVRPDARLLSVAGSWCEGEQRTGEPWPDVERVYWHQLSAWLARFDRSPSESDFSSQADHRRLVIVDAVDRETASAAIDVLADAGYSAVWAPRRGRRPLVAGAAAGLWIGGQLDGRQASLLADFCTEMRTASAPVTALLDFPRRDEVDLAESVGADAVIGKPWSIEDMIVSLAAAVAETRGEQETPLRITRAA